MNLHKLASRYEKDEVRVLVETPRGSCAKFAYDPETKTFELTKTLTVGLTFPYDYGFVPSTLAPDGDPIDVMVLHQVTTFPGIVLRCRLIGVLKLNQKEDGEKVRNDRLFAVPIDSKHAKSIEDVREMPKTLRKELEEFFIQTAALEDKEFDVLDWGGPKEAEELLREAEKALK